MSRIATRFTDLAGAGRTGLVPFVTAGDPLPDATVNIMHALVAAGADAIELGVPFSDPMADGPVIQHAGERALRRGVGLAHVIDWVRKFRDDDDLTPIVLMGYLNPVAIYGIDRFAADNAAAGVDGVLLVDCPSDESAIAQPLRDAGIDQIFMAAPTTSDERLSRTVEVARGFLYYVSFAGITGADRISIDDVRNRVVAIKQMTTTPVAVGFGVRDADTAAAIGRFADAVVIGSALVEQLADSGDEMEACRRARDFLLPIRDALDASAETGG